MIHLFLNLCKINRILKSFDFDEHVLCRELGLSSFESIPRCPTCGAPGLSFVSNGSYSRHLVCFVDDAPVDKEVTISCIRCSCGRTHALLPGFIIPYSVYSFVFIIKLLYSRLTRKFSNIPDLCTYFDISESTYYRIRRRFITDSHIFMEVFERFFNAYDLISGIINSDCLKLHSSLKLFHDTTGYFFLEPYIKLRLKVPLPDTISGYLTIP